MIATALSLFKDLENETPNYPLIKYLLIKLSTIKSAYRCDIIG